MKIPNNLLVFLHIHIPLFFTFLWCFTTNPSFIYIFIKGEGTMIVGTNTFEVKAGDTILIPDGDFHQVHNTGFYAEDDLEFICVFDGGRNH